MDSRRDKLKPGVLAAPCALLAAAVAWRFLAVPPFSIDDAFALAQTGRPAESVLEECRLALESPAFALAASLGLPHVAAALSMALLAVAIWRMARTCGAASGAWLAAFCASSLLLLDALAEFHGRGLAAVLLLHAAIDSLALSHSRGEAESYRRVNRWASWLRIGIAGGLASICTLQALPAAIALGAGAWCTARRRSAATAIPWAHAAWLLPILMAGPWLAELTRVWPHIAAQPIPGRTEPNVQGLVAAVAAPAMGAVETPEVWWLAPCAAAATIALAFAARGLLVVPALVAVAAPWLLDRLALAHIFAGVAAAVPALPLLLAAAAASSPSRARALALVLFAACGLASASTREIPPLPRLQFDAPIAPAAAPANGFAAALPEFQRRSDGWGTLEINAGRDASRWSVAERVLLRFDRPIPEGRWNLCLETFRTSWPVPNQRMRFGRAEAIVGEGLQQVRIAIEVDRPTTTLSVRHPLWRPADFIEGSRDHRDLGWCLHSAWIERILVVD